MSLLSLFFLPPRQLHAPDEPSAADVEPYTIGVASRGRFTSKPITTTAADSIRRDRSRHTATGKTISIQLHWMGTYMEGGSTQKPLPNPVTRSADLVYEDGTRVPFTFDGKPSAELEGGSWLATDELSLDRPIPAGGYFYLETRSEVRPGEIISVASGDYLDTSRNEGVKLGEASSWSNGYGVFPQAITGKTVTEGVHSLALIGDSIITGDRDTLWGITGTGGFGDRFALRVGAGWANYGRGGDAARILKSDEARAQRFGDTLKYHDVVLSDYGTNDWWGTPQLETMQANMLDLWQWVRGRMREGAKFYTTTSSPWAKNVTDAHITPEGQTPHERDYIRTGYNAWLRSGAPILGGVAVTPDTPGAILVGQLGHPLDGVVEMTDIIESSRDSGVWGSRGRVVEPLSVTAGSRIYTAPSDDFRESDVGAQSVIWQDGKSYWTTIRRVVSPTEIEGSWTGVTTGPARLGLYRDDYTSDSLHPSPYGYQLIADNLVIPGIPRPVA